MEPDAADTTPLVGMRLLDGHSLYVEVEDGGRVVIEPRLQADQHLEGGTAYRQVRSTRRYSNCAARNYI